MNGSGPLSVGLNKTGSTATRMKKKSPEQNEVGIFLVKPGLGYLIQKKRLLINASVEPMAETNATLEQSLKRTDQLLD
jgi:hypothetical protein